jgi:hypothetical protein
MCPVAVLGIYDGETPREAIREAVKYHTVYNNQFLDAVPYEDCPQDDRQEVCEYEQRETELWQPHDVGCIVCGAHPDKPMLARDAMWWTCPKHSPIRCEHFDEGVEL